MQISTFHRIFIITLNEWKLSFCNRLVSRVLAHTHIKRIFITVFMANMLVSTEKNSTMKKSIRGRWKRCICITSLVVRCVCVCVVYLFGCALFCLLQYVQKTIQTFLLLMRSISLVDFSILSVRPSVTMLLLWTWLNVVQLEQVLTLSFLFRAFLCARFIVWFGFGHHICTYIAAIQFGGIFFSVVPWEKKTSGLWSVTFLLLGNRTTDGLTNQPDNKPTDGYEGW